MLVKLLSRSFRCCTFAARILEERGQRGARAMNGFGSEYAASTKAQKDLWAGCAQWLNYYRNRPKAERR